VHHFFFFQAEDGIRDFHVTGVQTCALPIYSAAITLIPKSYAREISPPRRTTLAASRRRSSICWTSSSERTRSIGFRSPSSWDMRSEERRVGKEWRAQRGTDH